MLRVIVLFAKVIEEECTRAVPRKSTDYIPEMIALYACHILNYWLGCWRMDKLNFYNTITAIWWATESDWAKLWLAKNLQLHIEKLSHMLWHWNRILIWICILYAELIRHLPFYQTPGIACYLHCLCINLPY